MALSNNQGGSDEFFKSYVDLVKEDAITWEKFATLMNTLTPTLDRAKSLIAVLMEEFKASKEANTKKLVCLVDTASQYESPIENLNSVGTVEIDASKIKTEVDVLDNQMDTQIAARESQEASNEVSTGKDIKPLISNGTVPIGLETEQSFDVANDDKGDGNIIRIESVTSIASNESPLCSKSSSSETKIIQDNVTQAVKTTNFHEIKREIETQDNPIEAPNNKVEKVSLEVIKTEEAEPVSKESHVKKENGYEQIQANSAHDNSKASKNILHDASQLMANEEIPPPNESRIDSASEDKPNNSDEKEDSKDEQELVVNRRNIKETPKTKKKGQETVATFVTNHFITRINSRAISNTCMIKCHVKFVTELLLEQKNYKSIAILRNLKNARIVQ